MSSTNTTIGSDLVESVSKIYVLLNPPEDASVDAQFRILKTSRDD